MIETKVIKKIKFSVLSNKDMEKMSYATIKETANSWERTPIPESLNDPLTGTTSGICRLCGLPANKDIGHMGKIDLVRPVISPLFVKDVKYLLDIICIQCRALLITPDKRAEIAKLPREKRLEAAISLNIKKNCMYCNYANPIFRMHRNNKYQIMMGDAPIAPEFISQFFKSITPEDVELLGMSCRPEDFIWNYLLVIPPSMRPTQQSGDIHSEDGLNIILKNILKHNNKLLELYKKGNIYQDHYYTQDFRIEFETLCVFVMSYISTTGDAGTISYMKNSDKLKSIAMLNKGKDGNIRKNVSSKRQKQSARSVIAPDPYLPIDIIAIPITIAGKLTFEETVTPWNHERLTLCVRNGKNKYPGAHHVIKASTNSIIALIGDYISKIGKLENGDIVARNLLDGDIVIFNRQPSIHQYSMLTFRVRIIYGGKSVIRFNPTNCNPFNADFDGDAMIIYVPQTYRAISEARHLMYNHRHIVSDSGSVLIQLLHNNILGNYLLSLYFGKQISREMFLDLAFSTNIDSKILISRIKALGIKRAYYPEDIYELIFPDDLVIDRKEIKIINGKIMPSNTKIVIKEMTDSAQMRVKMYYTSEGKDIKDYVFDNYQRYKSVPVSDPVYPLLDDNVLNQIIVKYVYNNYPYKVTIGIMNALINLAARFLYIHGFTNTIVDINLNKTEQQKINDVIIEHHKAYYETLAKFERKEIQIPIYRTPTQEFEIMVWNIDNKLNKQIEEIANTHVKTTVGGYADLIRSKTKGNLSCVTQILAMLGAQVISGGRYPKLLGHRALPHQAKYSEIPSFGGFIMNSFNSGLGPIEDYVHVTGTREGLADTGVNMGKIGYLSRRLLTFLQDIIIANDNHCRRAGGKIINFIANGCGFNNKALMETVNPTANMSEEQYKEIYVW